MREQEHKLGDSLKWLLCRVRCTLSHRHDSFFFTGNDRPYPALPVFLPSRCRQRCSPVDLLGVTHAAAVGSLPGVFLLASVPSIEYEVRRLYAAPGIGHMG